MKLCAGCSGDRSRYEHECGDTRCVCGFVECIRRQADLAKASK